MEYNTIMEIGTIRNLLIALAVFLGATFIAYQIGRRDGLIHATENSIPVVDTLYIRQSRKKSLFMWTESGCRKFLFW